jgi:AcrR family transcriptional regulator
VTGTSERSGGEHATRRRTGVRTSQSGADTRTRLLDAAERLFAERGLDGVSVRDITELAKANTASVHYHFGSKTGLTKAILERRAGVMGRRRAELLDALEASKKIDLHAVAEAMVLPTAEMAATSDGGQHYVAFLAALGTHTELMSVLIDVHVDTGRYLGVLARVTPHLPEDVRLLRFAVAKDLVNRVLGQPAGQVHRWIEYKSPGADDHMVGSLTDIVVGIFAADVSD